MSTNQERRAEARQRLREQMEAQARREKQLKIGAASVVVVVLLGIVGVVVWKKAEEARAEQYAADWITCEYAPDEAAKLEKADPEEAEGKGAEAQKQVARQNELVDQLDELGRSEEPPTGDQPRRGTAEVNIATSAGDIPLTVDRANAPCNVASFVHLTERDFYNDTQCHRLSEDEGISVLQCGDPTRTGFGSAGYTVQDEPPTDLALADDQSGMSVYPRGTVAAPKFQAPDSGGSQFFLTFGDTMLPPNFAVLGTIDGPGLEVLDKIAKAGVKSENQTDPDFDEPVKPVVIKRMTVEGQAGLPEA